MIFFAGGPIWAMDWAPVATVPTNQILAIAPYRHRDDVSDPISAVNMNTDCLIIVFLQECVLF